MAARPFRWSRFLERIDAVLPPAVTPIAVITGIDMRELWAKYGTPSSELLERYHRRKAKEEAEAEEAAKDGTDEPAATAPK